MPWNQSFGPQQHRLLDQQAFQQAFSAGKGGATAGQTPDPVILPSQNPEPPSPSKGPLPPSTPPLPILPTQNPEPPAPTKGPLPPEAIPPPGPGPSAFVPPNPQQMEPPASLWDPYEGRRDWGAPQPWGPGGSSLLLQRLFGVR